MRKPWHIVKLAFLAQMQYRANFVAYLVLTTLLYASKLFYFEGLFQFTDALGGWGRPEVLTLLLVAMLLSLAVDTFAASLYHFFWNLTRGRLDPYVTMPLGTGTLLFLRWSKPANVIPLLLLSPLVVKLLGDAGAATTPSTVSLALVAFVLGVLCNLLFIALLSLMTIVVERDFPVGYIHDQVFRLASIPPSLFPMRFLRPLIVFVPVVFCASVPAAVLCRGDASLVPWLAAAFLLFLASFVIFFRKVVRSHDGFGG